MTRRHTLIIAACWVPVLVACTLARVVWGIDAANMTAIVCGVLGFVIGGVLWARMPARGRERTR